MGNEFSQVSNQAKDQHSHLEGQEPDEILQESVTLDRPQPLSAELANNWKEN